MSISGKQLRSAYLSASMLQYFREKFRQLSKDELLARIEETLKFLAIAHYCSGPIPVSAEIDDVWHYWILETKEYDRLCKCLPGGQFIHHTSNDYTKSFGENMTNNQSLKIDVGLLATYVLNYGPFEESRVKYWVLASYLVDKRGWQTQQLNEWLTSAAPAAPV